MIRVAILALVLVAAGCTEDAATTAEQGGEAAGEVLPGSISDAMIPLEQLESQAPLAPRQAVPVGAIDEEQPEVTPVPGINDSPASEEAGAASAAPTPQAAE